MFGLDPFSRPVAIAEMLLLLAFAAFVGWLIARLLLKGRVEALQAEIADKETELEICRRSKVARPATPPANVVRTTYPPKVDVPALAPPPVPVMAAPVLDVPVELPPVVVPPVVNVPAPTPIVTGTTEDAVLNRIAARASEINFDRIGRAAASEADDLKEIVGVGPFLERKLHSLGIYTFRQVANFTKEDIDKVNEIIEFFPGRIERDNWVSQSNVFHEKKYGSKA
jgi:predicted flap endonuclease-1-like 5' DNA nuclease